MEIQDLWGYLMTSEKSRLQVVGFLGLVRFLVYFKEMAKIARFEAIGLFRYIIYKGKGDTLMTKMYEDNMFTIYHTSDGYLLHNHTLDGFAHTHLKNYGTAIRIIELSRKKKCPLDLPRYLVISLYRVNGDEVYRGRIEQVLEMRKRVNYYNRTRALAMNR